MSSRLRSLALLAALCTLTPLAFVLTHAQTASVNQLLLTLRQQDLTGTPILNRQIGYLSYNGTVGNFTNSITTSTGSFTVTLPTAIVLNLYIRNTASSGTLTVTWTKQGGSSQSICVLDPGAEIVLWNTSTSATAGITALTLQSSVSSLTYEMFLGG